MTLNKIIILNISIQILLGLIFLVSAILKVVSYGVFLESLMSFGFLKINYIQYIAICVIVVELFIGLAIIYSIFLKFTLILSLLILGVFEFISIYSLLFDRNWICACFGSLLLGSFSLSSILRDGFIILITIYVYLFRIKDYNYKNFPYIVTISLVLSFGLLFIILLNPLLDRSKKTPLQLSYELKDIKIQSVDNQWIDTSIRTKPFILYIVFNTDKDCISCLTEYPLWNKIYENFRDEIEIIGIGKERDYNFIRIWKNIRNIKFKMISDQKNKIFDNYYISTPMKILINNENKVILMQKSSDDLKKQNNFVQEIEKIYAAFKMKSRLIKLK